MSRPRSRRPTWLAGAAVVPCVLGGCRPAAQCDPPAFWVPELSACAVACHDDPAWACYDDDGGRTDVRLTPTRDAGRDTGLDATADAGPDSLDAARVDAPDAFDVAPDRHTGDAHALAIRDPGAIEGTADDFTPSTQAQSAYASAYASPDASPPGRLAVYIDGDAQASCAAASQSAEDVSAGRCVPGRRLLTFVVPKQVGTYEVRFGDHTAPGVASLLVCRSDARGYSFGVRGSVAVTALDATASGHVALLFDVTFGDGQLRGRVDAPYCP
jgi:hypothetical protein